MFINDILLDSQKINKIELLNNIVPYSKIILCDSRNDKKFNKQFESKMWNKTNLHSIRSLGLVYK